MNADDTLPTGLVPGAGDVYVDGSAFAQYRHTGDGWTALSRHGDPAWLLTRDEAAEQTSRAVASSLEHAAELIREHATTIATNARDAHAAVELVAWMCDRMAESEREQS